MTREEMLEKLQTMNSLIGFMEDYAKTYENTGTRDSLEQIEANGRGAVRLAKELQDWHA